MREHINNMLDWGTAYGRAVVLNRLSPPFPQPYGARLPSKCHVFMCDMLPCSS